MGAIVEDDERAHEEARRRDGEGEREEDRDTQREEHRGHQRDVGDDVREAASERRRGVGGHRLARQDGGAWLSAPETGSSVSVIVVALAWLASPGTRPRGEGGQPPGEGLSAGPPSGRRLIGEAAPGE